MKYLMLFTLLVSQTAYSYEGPRMTGQVLKVSQDGQRCALKTASGVDRFEFGKKGFKPETHSGCKIIFSEEEFYGTFQFCHKLDEYANEGSRPQCDIWTENRTVTFYIDKRGQGINFCHFMCVTSAKSDQ